MNTKKLFSQHVFSRVPPEKISQVLQEQEIDNIKQLVPLDTDVNFDSWEGKEVLRQCKTRIKQRCFRNLILNNYHARCCLTGIAVPDLLIARVLSPPTQHSPDRKSVSPKRIEPGRLG